MSVRNYDRLNIPLRRLVFFSVPSPSRNQSSVSVCPTGLDRDCMRFKMWCVTTQISRMSAGAGRSLCDVNSYEHLPAPVDVS